jgi:glycosyltransferase involved in cell wall biosynthesis
VNILFVHQNMPGQFKHLAPGLAAAGHRVVFITNRDDIELPGLQRVTYKLPRRARDTTHHYVRLFENGVIYGQQVVRACQSLASQGFRPDVIVAHPGWGEALFLKDFYPRTPLLNYCEFYYHGRGADVGFDPDEPADIDDVCKARARNAHLLLSLESCDAGLTPTEWQKSLHPSRLRSKISVIFDGIDTERVRPNPHARLTLPSGRVLTASDEVVTYVARNLEPYRGFPSFIRALPKILTTRPEAQVVVLGGDEVSYGRSPKEGKNWREAMIAEVPLDLTRVHFLGKVPFDRYLALLQISSTHVYLTRPFVLSWSCLEAMAAGCLVVASATPPVEEVITDGKNGLLVDFHDAAAIAERTIEALGSGPSLAGLRRRARDSVVKHYALARCLPRQIKLVRELAGS